MKARFLLLPILIISASVSAHARPMTCGEYAAKAAEAAGFTWKDGVAVASGALGATAGALSVSASSSGMPMEAASPGMKVFVNGAIATGAVVGAVSSYTSLNFITSNTSDIINLSDEVQLGGGQTLDVLTETIILSMEGALTLDNVNRLKAPVQKAIADVLSENPELCNNADSSQIINEVVSLVKARI